MFTATRAPHEDGSSPPASWPPPPPPKTLPEPKRKLVIRASSYCIPFSAIQTQTNLVVHPIAARVAQVGLPGLEAEMRRPADD